MVVHQRRHRCNSARGADDLHLIYLHPGDQTDTALTIAGSGLYLLLVKTVTVRPVIVKADGTLKKGTSSLTATFSF
jgi:hypothetical protein